MSNNEVGRTIARGMVMRAAREVAGAISPSVVHGLDAVQVIEHRRPSAVAGKAKRGKVIEISLLLCDNDQEYEKTFAHEMAHIICQLAFPGKRINHGPVWKSIMLKMGYEPERCHKIDVAARMPGRWTKVVCVCGRDYQLGPRQSQNLRRGAKRYRCRCGEPLKL